MTRVARTTTTLRYPPEARRRNTEGNSSTKKIRFSYSKLDLILFLVLNIH